MKKLLSPIALFSAALIIDASAAAPDIIVRFDSLDAVKDLACKVCDDLTEPGSGIGEAIKTESDGALKAFLGAAFKEAPDIDAAKPIYCATVAKPDGEAWYLVGVPTSAAEPEEKDGVFAGRLFSAYADGYSWLSNKKEIAADAALLAEIRAFKGAFAKYPVNGKIRDVAAADEADEQMKALSASMPCCDNPFSKLIFGIIEKAQARNKLFGAADFAFAYTPKHGFTAVSSVATHPDAEGTKALLATPAVSADNLAKLSADALCYSAVSFESSAAEMMPEADEWLAVIPFDRIDDAEVAATVSNYVTSVSAAAASMKSANFDVAFDKAGRIRVTSFGDLGDTAAARNAYKALGDLVRRASAGKDGVKVEDTATGLALAFKPCALCGKCPKAAGKNEQCAAVAKKLFGDEISLHLSADNGASFGVLSIDGSAAPETSAKRPLALLAALEKEFPGARPVSVGAFSLSRLMRDGVIPVASVIDPDNASDLKNLFDATVGGCGEISAAGGILGDRCVSVSNIDLAELKTALAGFNFFQMQAMKAMMEAGCGVECDGEDAAFDEEECDGCEGGVCPLPAPAK